MNIAVTSYAMDDLGSIKVEEEEEETLIIPVDALRGVKSVKGFDRFRTEIRVVGPSGYAERILCFETKQEVLNKIAETGRVK